MSDKSRMLELEMLMAKEEEDLKDAERITQEIAPILQNLTKSEILNPVVLRVKLAKIDKKYRDILYALFRIAITSGPDGSFMILSPEKVMAIINDRN